MHGSAVRETPAVRQSRALRMGYRRGGLTRRNRVIRPRSAGSGSKGSRRRSAPQWPGPIAPRPEHVGAARRRQPSGGSVLFAADPSLPRSGLRVGVSTGQVPACSWACPRGQRDRDQVTTAPLDTPTLHPVRLRYGSVALSARPSRVRPSLSTRDSPRDTSPSDGCSDWTASAHRTAVISTTDQGGPFTHGLHTPTPNGG